MQSILKAKATDGLLLSLLGSQSFIESHGSSAAKADIDQYVKEKFTEEIFKKEISDPKNIFHIIYLDGKAAGYSKIIFDVNHPNIPKQNVTKLERLYLLKEFYGLKSGLELFNFNVELSKKNGQSGMWLFVWTKNQRAVHFYEKAGFKVVGSFDFKLTETHSNPNHQMFMEF